jgi:hypothetical protein
MFRFPKKIDDEKGTWYGSAWIPMDYLPPGVDRFNAYAIHGVGDDRKYEALFPVPGEFPDFHRLEHFQPIDLSRLRAGPNDIKLLVRNLRIFVIS